ncbi:hypothetical protein ACQ4PT_033304 [Festuca glaucescens]
MLNLLLILLFTGRPWTAGAQADSATDSVRHSNCNNASGFYEQNSIYKSNILRLGANLSTLANLSGFASGKVGAGPNTVNGLVLCRGDYTGTGCTDDLNAAFRSATASPEFCMGYKDATIFFDQYTLRYSSTDFLSGLSNEPEWPGKNKNLVTSASAAARFMERAVELLNTAADFAAFSLPSKYATGEAGFDEERVSVVYGLVQCTPDLTKQRCRSCLAGIIAQMPTEFSSSAGTSIGGRILGVRCNLRYEKELFFEERNDTIMIHMPKKLLLHRDLVILEKEIVNESDSRFSLFRYSKIREATDNFSKQNKLGEGGFGLVYQGKLSNEQEIAVKRLSPNSVQGFREFMNEIKLIASLQHRNLVRLLGCCIKSKERILIYEYMPNGSLEEFLFGAGENQSWHVRRRIIEGIAEGLLYIHDYAHACIVHRDLKPSNILLDHEMNPKISDFGIARICLSNVTESNTTAAMGTFGYIAPEYYSQNIYSTKSDVFSFGILVLEIVSGKRAVGSYKMSGRSYELRRYAWQLWRGKLRRAG